VAQGRALNIGLNAVDPRHYGGWSGKLTACEADAEDMAAIADEKGYDVTTLMTKAATRQRVRTEISKAADTLDAGDIFLLSYSGHGGQLPDRNRDEPDAQDETWCLYDAQLVDDELYALFEQFAEGVRILVFSDSCHSGSVVKLAYYEGTVPGRSVVHSAREAAYRNMPSEQALKTYRANKAFYDELLDGIRSGESGEDVSASVLLISGCQDNQLSADGDFNGLFTSQMLQVWRDGAFKGHYRRFHRNIVRRMPPNQTPNYFRAGKVNPDFEAQTPFTV
jgi:metacaspase-1